jgi:hypothetical protein
VNMEDKFEVDCDKCAYREDFMSCALGVGDPDEPCPGYHPEPCKECESNPCQCRVFCED